LSVHVLFAEAAVVHTVRIVVKKPGFVVLHV